jgi:hypothetical protein
MWKPVVAGAAARALEAGVRSIADVLEAAVAREDRPFDRVLFWAYAAGALEDPAVDAAYERSVEVAMASLATSPPRSLDLFYGLPNAGFVLSAITDGTADALDAIDANVVRAIEGGWDGTYDLISGTAGLGVYLVERARAGSAVASGALAHVVRHLEAAAAPAGVGRTWLTPQRHIASFTPERFPAGQFNCGVSHGAPGAIACLAAIAGIESVDATTRARARSLALDASAWLDAQALAGDGCFPEYIVPGEPATYTLSAWCYGDPGVAVTMWAAMARLGAATERWQRLARDAAQRSLAHRSAVDPGLCHGAAGFAHMFNRCFQASGDPLFQDVAAHWFARALDARVAGAGIAGWTATTQGPEGGNQVAADDLLEGVVGIGLAMIAAIRPTEPVWDRLLGIDVSAAPG